MLKILVHFSISVIFLSLNSTSVFSQDTPVQTPLDIDGVKITGTFKPKGPPIAPPVRESAGGNCIVEIKQAYVITGSLSGSLVIDYRIIIFGPCELPPKPGKYDEEWIAYGSFSGSIAEKSVTCTLVYTAQVKAGGNVEGSMKLGDGLTGELAVSGNFNDGNLTYEGWIESE